MKFSKLCRLNGGTKIRQNPCFEVVAGVERVYFGIFFSDWGCFEALGDKLGGCVCPWGFPGLLLLFLGGLPVLRCGMVCRVASGLVVDCWGSVGGKSGDVYAFDGLSSVILGPSCLEGGCCGGHFSPHNHLNQLTI